MRVAVIADTHVPHKFETLSQRMLENLQGVQQIIHCGDIVEPQVLKELEMIAPVEAVAGNHDRERFQNTIPQQKILNFANYKVGVIHGDEFASRHLKRSELLIKLRETVVEPFLDGEALDIILFGHCHQPILESIVAEFYPFGKFSLKTKKNVLLFNPGMPVRNRSLSSMGYITFMENSFNIELKVFTTKK